MGIDETKSNRGNGDFDGPSAGSVRGSPFDPERLTVASIARSLHDGEISATEVHDFFVDRRNRLDEDLNAFCFVDAERTRQNASMAERRMKALGASRALLGVPLAVKDDLSLAGWPLRKGSLTTDNTLVKSSEQSPSVMNLLRFGMTVIGKTSLPELGWKATTQSPLTGITRNPWNRAMTPGGSSGGNAAALAAGMVPAALGTDIGGSVRIPASFCGVVGFKPTQTTLASTAVAKTGLLLRSGPMARTVKDIALLMKGLGAEDPTRPKSLLDPERLDDALVDNLSEMRIAVSPGLGFCDLDPDIDRAVERAARAFENMGAGVDWVDPLEESPAETYEALYLPQLARDVDKVSPERRELMDETFLRLAEEGREVSGVEVFLALARRRELIQKMMEVHRHYDVMISATVPVLPFEAERECPRGWPEGRWWCWTPLTATFNLTGQPAISVPCGRSESGLPIGLQISGPHHRDDLVLGAAHCYQLFGYWPEMACLDLDGR